MSDETTKIQAEAPELQQEEIQLPENAFRERKSG